MRLHPFIPAADCQSPPFFQHAGPPPLPVASADAELHTGAKTLVARAAADGKAVALEVWGSSGVLVELVVPPSQHGALYNDGWFSRGATWSPDESRVVYVAEVPPAWLIH